MAPSACPKESSKGSWGATSLLTWPPVDDGCLDEGRAVWWAGRGARVRARVLLLLLLLMLLALSVCPPPAVVGRVPAKFRVRVVRRRVG